MEITRLTLGDYMTNCYIVYTQGAQSCCVIDPGYEAERILNTVQCLGLKIEAILLTHGHFDHVGAVAEIAAETDCKVYISAADLNLPPMMTGGKLYYTDTYRDTLTAAGLTFRIMPTPGHTPGSVCLIGEDVIFSGDTLFRGSCGRTDFPGGSPSQMAASLKALSALPGNYRVYPGHGDSTELAWERETNPYMRDFS